MKNAGKYTPFLASAMLMWIVLYLLYPHYQYFIDPDGTAYLTISKRYANGDFANAINGYWSPWSCWLTAILIKWGFMPIPASVIVNTAGATGFLYISNSFFNHFLFSPAQRWLYSGALVAFLCYAVFGQSFDDLWECFFLLSALKIMTLQAFNRKPILWVLTGILGALAYFAKAYSFPFFIVSTLLCSYILSKRDKMLTLKVSFVAICTLLICALPWLMALHAKYGMWTTSTAGSLNLSWYLIDHPYWKQGIHILVPPITTGSPYYWEDPYLVNGATPHFWDSWQLFTLQIAKLGLNSLKLLLSVAQLSLFFPFIIAYAIISVLRKKKNAKYTRNILPLKAVIAAFLLFPTGYFLINYESRYLWYLLPLAIVIAGIFVQTYISASILKMIATLAFCISITLYPIWKLSKMYDEGKREYLFAQCLNQAHIDGTMVANLHPRILSKIAYFSGNSFYFIAKQTPDNISKTENTIALKNEIEKYSIKYYLYSPPTLRGTNESPSFQDLFFENLGNSYKDISLPLVLDDPTTGVKVYLLNK